MQVRIGSHGETVSDAARRVKALAGTNGGFFTNINPLHVGSPRSPVGATVVDGNLIATAAGGRPGVEFDEAQDGSIKVSILQDMTTRVTVSDVRNSTMPVEAIDRPILGTVVNCGAPADSPTRKPAHD